MSLPEDSDVYMFHVKEKLREIERNERRFNWTVIAIVAGLFGLTFLIYHHP